MTAIKLLWGPGSFGRFNAHGAALATVGMNDADNAVACSFCFPKDGTITNVGFLISAKAGTPPAYNVGIVTLDASGRATTIAYGGSAIKAYTPTSTGWKWITLDTSATAVAGEYAAVYVYPTNTAPDASNNITVCVGEVGENGLAMYWTTSWITRSDATAMAVKYDDGSIHGWALTSVTAYVSLATNTTPDEVGCKFTVPFDMTVVGAKFVALSTYVQGPFDIVLYDASNTVLATSSTTDKDFADEVSTHIVYFDAVNLTAGATYRLTFKPSSTSTIALTRHSLESTAAKLMYPEGANWQGTARTDAGNWTDTSTDLIPMALIVSDVTFAAPTAYGFIG